MRNTRHIEHPGGTGVGEGNLIAFSTDNGVNLVAGTGNAILGNAIFSNTELGIDLVGGIESNGVTANDLGDGDSGPNNLQNYPVLTSAPTDGVSNITIDGTFNSTASTMFRIEFFASVVEDLESYGEAETYLGFDMVTTDGAATRHLASHSQPRLRLGSSLVPPPQLTSAAEIMETHPSSV